MLYWLLQSQTAHPALAQGQAPANLLSPEEEVELTLFSVQARRRDWLLGRWTAKRLLQQIVEQHCGYEVPLYEIVIRKAADDAPVTDFREPFTGRQFSITLSHSQGYALCAAIEGQDVRLGADLEVVAPRAGRFVEEFLTKGERELLYRPGSGLRELHVTALWSAKESALKAVRQGFRLDPRSVSCLVQPVAAEPQDWIPFRIVWHEEKDTPSPLPELTGWWQALGDLVLTLAAQL